MGIWCVKDGKMERWGCRGWMNVLIFFIFFEWRDEELWFVVCGSWFVVCGLWCRPCSARSSRIGKWGQGRVGNWE